MGRCRHLVCVRVTTFWGGCWLTDEKVRGARVEAWIEGTAVFEYPYDTGRDAHWAGGGGGDTRSGAVPPSGNACRIVPLYVPRFADSLQQVQVRDPLHSPLPSLVAPGISSNTFVKVIVLIREWSGSLLRMYLRILCRAVFVLVLLRL